MQSHGRECAWLRTPLAAVGFALALAAWASGQPGFLMLGSNDFELTAPQIETVSGATQSRLEQVKALVADGQWDAAVEALREIAAEDDGRLVAVEEGTFVSLPTYCQIQLASLPPEGLAAYRRQVDPAAEAAFREALAVRDPAALSRVVDEMFCSSSGDDALMALGELALARGDYAAARRAWHAIGPQLRDPQGRAPWFALYDVDLPRQWPALRERWENRDGRGSWLAYPDTDLDLADVRARLVLTSIREGDFQRAALELDLLRRLHAGATGRIGGVDGPYVAALERLLATAREWPARRTPRDWPTFARLPSRNGIARALGPLDRHAWRQPVTLPDIKVQVTRGLTFQGGGGNIAFAAPALAVRETQHALHYFPVVVEGVVYTRDVRTIYAADLATGKPAITEDGVIHKFVPGTGETAHQASLAAGQPRYTLTVAGGVLYARLGDDVTGRLHAGRSRNEERLVGLDLARDGLLVFQVRPENGMWSFDGAPVADGERVYVAMRHSDVRPGAYVASYDAATGRRLWRTFVAAADTPAAGVGDEATHNLLTLVGDRIYFNTNLGAVAALDAESGQIAWLRRYDRAAGKQAWPGALHFDRELSPCVYDRGLVFVAPADSPQVFAIDAETGATVWVANQLGSAVHLLGVVDGTLVASGNQLWALEARSGRVRFVWPGSEHAGVRGFGRGLIAGREVFWPTRDKILVFDVATWEQSREPIALGPTSDCGANLVAAEGRLIVVGKNRMMAYGGQAAPKPREESAEDVETVAANPFRSSVVTQQEY